MSGALGLRAPSSGGPFENLMAGVFLACGFVVDVDLLWTIPGQGDIAQFDFVASARAGTSIRRIIVECKGGDRWGYSDAFQLLGQTVLTGQDQAVLLVAQRHSAEREARSASAISRQFAGTGLHVIAVPVDDSVPGAPVADIGAVEHALFTQGLVAIPGTRLEAADVEACTRGIARLRGAIERIGRTLVNPMSPPAPSAADLLDTVRDWPLIAGDTTQRLALLRACLAAPNGSQAGWNPEAAAAHPHFARDVASIEAYAAAQEVAAAIDVVYGDRTRVPFDGSWSSTSDLDVLRNVDLHAVSWAACVIAVTAPWSQVAITARQAHGPTIAQLTTSRRLRQRCRQPRDRSPRERSRKSASRNPQSG